MTREDIVVLLNQTIDTYKLIHLELEHIKIDHYIKKYL